jgi:predicted nucleotidyltransferase
MKFGLDDKKIGTLITIFSKYKTVRKAKIFGSRARGDFKYNSDIDIAIYTNGGPITGLFQELDEAVGIYKVNLIVMDKLKNDKFRQNIEQDGIKIYTAQPDSSLVSS